MTLQERLALLIAAMGTDVKGLQSGQRVAGAWSTGVESAQVAGPGPFAMPHCGFIPMKNRGYWIYGNFSFTTGNMSSGVQPRIVGPTSGIARAAFRIFSGIGSLSNLIENVGLNIWSTAGNGSTTGAFLCTIEGLIQTDGTYEFGPADKIYPEIRAELATDAIVNAGSSFFWKELA